MQTHHNQYIQISPNVKYRKQCTLYVEYVITGACVIIKIKGKMYHLFIYLLLL